MRNLILRWMGIFLGILAAILMMAWVYFPEDLPMVASAAVAAVLFYGTQCLGLLSQSKRIENRETFAAQKTPEGLMFGHKGRFMTWIGVGAERLLWDPVTGWMFVLSRVWGILLVDRTSLQRKIQAPTWRDLLREYGVQYLIFLGAVIGIALLSPNEAVRWSLYVVNLCFFAYTAWETGKRVKSLFIEMRRGNFFEGVGQLRMFQWGVMGNFFGQLLYGLIWTTSGLQLLMMVGFGVGLIVQIAYVVLIEISIRRYRDERDNGTH